MALVTRWKARETKKTDFITQYLAIDKKSSQVGLAKGEPIVESSFPGATQINSRADLLPRPAYQVCLQCFWHMKKLSTQTNFMRKHLPLKKG